MNSTAASAPPAGVPLLSARRLYLGYGDTVVLRDVDLAIASGQFWFFLGPNGSGKTTLLRALLGTLAPRSGGLDVHPPLRDRRAIGFVPQRSAPNPILPTTVREFVALGLVGARLDRARSRTHLEWALEHTGLAGLERQSYWALSGGQRQRALVARALVRRPQLLILDEPTNHLDFLIEEAILDLLSELRRTHGTAIVFVTHALHLATRHATHVALFHAGTVEGGSAETLLHSRRIEHLYGVSPRLARQP